jgi:hypothetical protein
MSTGYFVSYKIGVVSEAGAVTTMELRAMRKKETHLFIELTVVVLCLCRRLLVHRVILDVLSSRHLRLFLLVSHVRQRHGGHGLRVACGM